MKTLKSMKNLDAELSVSVDEYVSNFGNKMMLGIQAISSAAQIYAEALKKFPSIAEERFKKAYPEVEKNTWDMMEWIGNGDLSPLAYRLPYQIAKKITHIPIERQDKMFNSGVRGFKVLNTSTMKADVVPLSGLSSSQATILIDIDNGKVRSIEEQKKVIDARPEYFKPMSAKNCKKEPKYVIKGNVLVIRGVEIGKETLKKILAEMERTVRVRKEVA